MLEPSRRRTDAERKARHRDRQRRGVVCPRGVEVSAVGLNFLISTRWLQEGHADDLAAIGDAISRWKTAPSGNNASRVDIWGRERMP